MGSESKINNRQKKRKSLENGYKSFSLIIESIVQRQVYAYRLQVGLWDKESVGANFCSSVILGPRIAVTCRRTEKVPPRVYDMPQKVCMKGTMPLCTLKLEYM